MKVGKFVAVVGALAGAVVLSGCATSRAPLTKSGGKVEISVLSNRGKESEMEARQWQYRNEVGSYMETDLINRLNRSGYDAKLIHSKSEFTPGEGKYLVCVEVESYNPGSNVARMLVGFGAGACSMDCHYAVFGQGSESILSWDDGVGTSGDWRRIPNTLDDRLVRKLNTELAAMP